MAVALFAHAAPRRLVQLAVHARPQLLQPLLVSATPCQEKLSDLVSGAFGHERLSRMVHPPLAPNDTTPGAVSPAIPAQCGFISAALQVLPADLAIESEAQNRRAG
jgi:hypothetical protein